MLDNITSTDVHRLYQLSLNEKTASLTCTADKSVILKLLELGESGGVIDDMINTFSFKNFVNNPKAKNYGFNGCFTIVPGPSSDSVCFIAKIPPLFENVGLCDYCKGSGNFLGSQCFFCDNTGRNYNQCYVQGYELSASLNLIMQAALTITEQSKNNQSQLISIMLETGDRPSADIEGELSSILVNWLAKNSIRFEKEFAPKIITAMAKVYKKLHPNYRLVHKSGFRAVLHNDWHLLLDCPGNACGINALDPNGDGNKNAGYKFSCHNVHSVVQQLTLLAGLIKLCDLYEQDHKTPT